MGAKERLLQAMETCLETTSIDQIKVGDLTSAADVSRQTFYRLYNDKYELLKDFYQERIVSLYEYPPTPESVSEGTLKTFEYLVKHRNVARNMFFSKDYYALKPYLRDMFYETDLDFWRAQGVDVENEHYAGVLRLYAYGTVSFIMDWIRTDMPLDAKTMTSICANAVPVCIVEASGLSYPPKEYRLR